MTHRLAFGLALAVSAGLHVAGLGLGSAREETQIEAGAGAMDVAVGNSFADLAVGTLKAKQLTTPEPVTPSQPEMLKADPAIAEVTAHSTPQSSASQTPIERAQVTQPKDVLLTQPVPISHVAPKVTAKSKLAVAASTDPSVVTSERSVETLAFVETPTPAPTVSKRPVVRSASLVVPKAKPKPKKKTAALATRGNANQNAKAGAKAKPSPAKASNQGTQTSRIKAQGNAAATNYPGQVMRKINRVPKPRISANGAAFVRFTISSTGGLAGLSLARSSGSSQFDKAALRVIKRAAPFPKPPPGAQRSFSLTIKGK